MNDRRKGGEQLSVKESVCPIFLSYSPSSLLFPLFDSESHTKGGQRPTTPTATQRLESVKSHEPIKFLEARFAKPTLKITSESKSRA